MPNDTIGNRTRDLPACGAVPQLIAPPRVWYPAVMSFERHVILTGLSFDMVR
jgi:hypothetical protein